MGKGKKGRHDEKGPLFALEVVADKVTVARRQHGCTDLPDYRRGETSSVPLKRTSCLAVSVAERREWNPTFIARAKQKESK